MLVLKVLAHPLNKVVLEDPLDELVEQTWGNELVDVCIWKVFCEWLGRGEFWVKSYRLMEGTHSSFIDNAISVPQGFRTICGFTCICVFSRA
jgi:hypothetical protein